MIFSFSVVIFGAVFVPETAPVAAVDVLRGVFVTFSGPEPVGDFGGNVVAALFAG